MSSDKYSDGRAVAVFDKKDNFLGLRGRGAGAGELLSMSPFQAKGGRRGMRIPFGRYAAMANDTTNGRTHHLVMDLPDGADELMLIGVNTQTAQVVDFQAQACAMANLNNINNSDGSAGAWSSLVSFKDNASNASIGRVPVALSATRPKYILSDPVAIETPARTDGGVGALVGVRFFMRTTTPTYTVMGNGGSDDFSGWVNRSDGRTLIMRSQAGQHLIPTTGFTSTTNEKQSPIAGVIFLARGQVINVVRFGDSIMDGRGTAIGDGYIGPACVQATKDTGIVFCDSNLAWAGVGSATYAQHAKDFIEAFSQYIDVVVMPDGTPNDADGVPISASIVAARRRRVSDAIDAASRARIPVLLATWAATNPALRNWDASDALRRETVEAVKKLRDVYVIDTDSVWSGGIDADGQAGMVAGVHTDNIHPNDAGNRLAVPLAVDQLKRVIRRL